MVSVRSESGVLVFEDLLTGEVIRHRFTDEADCGDEYNFSPVVGDRVRESTEAQIQVETHHGRASAALKVRGTWALPEGLSEDRAQRVGTGGVNWELEARLLPGVRGAQLHIAIENGSRDHRFRARFSLKGNPDSFVTDGPFDWIPRAAGAPAPAPTSQELPVPTHPMNTIAAVSLENTTLGLGGVGLREVELGEGGELSLTLLRSVGWLSRSDLPNRNREAGPNLPTPGAQGIGTHHFNYAVAFQDRHVRLSEIHRKLEPMLFQPSVVTVTEASIEELPLLAVEPASIRLAAVKRAENDGRLMIRLVGADSGQPVEAMVKVYGRVRKAWISDLDEREGTKLSPVYQGNETMIMVPVPARDVVTLALED